MPSALAQCSVMSAARISVGRVGAGDRAFDDADAGGDRQLVAVDRNGSASSASAASATLIASSGAGGVLDQDDELVAAEPGDQVRRPGQAAQPLGDGDQQLVADVVARGCR